MSVWCVVALDANERSDRQSHSEEKENIVACRNIHISLAAWCTRAETITSYGWWRLRLRLL
jgi:hypothetical protein